MALGMMVTWHAWRGLRTGWCVLEQTNQVRLGGLLQSQYGRGLEAQVGLEVLGDRLTHQALEGQLADQQLSGRYRNPEPSTSGTYCGSRAAPRYTGIPEACIDGASSQRRWQARTCVPPLWGAACGEPCCHRWTCERSA
eukprot:1186713-Prorocentrum_minimum.AAC.3